MPKQKSSEDHKDTFAEIVEAIDSVEVDPDRHLSIQIDRCLREAIQAAQSSGQAATVSLSIKVKPGGGDRRVDFLANVAAKLPRPKVSGVTLYADDAGHIHRSNPDQQTLPLSPVARLAPKDA